LRLKERVPADAVMIGRLIADDTFIITEFRSFVKRKIVKF